MSYNNRRVLYGCALPMVGQVPLNNWFTSKLVAEKKVNLIIEKLNCFISGEDTIRFMDMLDKGKTYNDISLNVGLNNLPGYFENLFFSVKNYRYRPPIFLETRDSIMYYIKELRPTPTFNIEQLRESISDLLYKIEFNKESMNEKVAKEIDRLDW